MTASYLVCGYSIFWNALYGIYNRQLLDENFLEVICIGNVSVGGTGKTPAVHFFVKKLLARGRKVAVVSRGYRGKRKRDPLLVSDGMVIFATPQESGDESCLHAINLPGMSSS